MENNDFGGIVDNAVYSNYNEDNIYIFFIKPEYTIIIGVNYVEILVLFWVIMVGWSCDGHSSGDVV